MTVPVEFYNKKRLFFCLFFLSSSSRTDQCQTSFKSTVSKLQELSRQAKQADDLLSHLKSKPMQVFLTVREKVTT